MPIPEIVKIMKKVLFKNDTKGSHNEAKRNTSFDWFLFIFLTGVIVLLVMIITK